MQLGRDTLASTRQEQRRLVAGGGRNADDFVGFPTASLPLTVFEPIVVNPMVGDYIRTLIVEPIESPVPEPSADQTTATTTPPDREQGVLPGGLTLP